MLEILDSVTQPGDPNWPNEDSIGAVGRHMWVIDGATGVADKPFVDPVSDARWLAQNASDYFYIWAAEQEPPDMTDLVRMTMETLKQRFEAQADRAISEPYEKPSASMLIAEAYKKEICFSYFGDCGMIIQEEGQLLRQLGGARGDTESLEAKRLRAEAVSWERSEETLERLRENRARMNTKGGYWIFGIEPDAVKMMATVVLQFRSPITGLLYSDGFGALVTDYERYTDEELLDAAQKKGLEALMKELREIERREDPDGEKFPRFKQSDDASAILFRFVPEGL